MTQRILVVDDSKTVRILVGGMLRDAGYDVLEAADGISAAQVVLAEPIDAVVTDQHMPAMSGLQLCRVIGADPSMAGLPVVLLTATSGREVAFWAERCGAAGFVAKDALATLLPTVARVLAEAPKRLSRSRRRIEREQVHARIAELLDHELEETILANEISRVGQVLAAGALKSDLATLADALASFVLRIVDTRWMWLSTTKQTFVYSAAADAAAADTHLRASVAVPGSTTQRGASGLVQQGHRRTALPIVFGDREIGTIGFATMHDGTERLALVARELAAPLQVCLLLQQATEDARTDALTGLLNRRSASDQLERELAFARRNRAPLGVVMIDLDHFKQINDRYGHDGGDAALVGAATAIRSALRGSDFCARWGGEEFVVVVRDADAHGTLVVAERIRNAIATASIVDVSGTRIPVTASCGVAVVRAEDTAPTLLNRADEALYTAKRSGRNRVAEAA